jgi:hypothetical protein
MRIRGGEGRNEKSGNNNSIRTNTEEETRTTTKTKMKVTKENLPFGHVCDDIVVDNDTPYVRVYC